MSIRLISEIIENGFKYDLCLECAKTRQIHPDPEPLPESKVTSIITNLIISINVCLHEQVDWTLS